MIKYNPDFFKDLTRLTYSAMSAGMSIILVIGVLIMYVIFMYHLIWDFIQYLHKL